MEARQPELLRKRVNEILACCLSSAKGAVRPAEFGVRCFRDLSHEEQESLLEFGPALIEEVFIHSAKAQTKGRAPKDTEQVEAFPLDTWISAKNPGERVQYRHATREDHIAHREHQIANVRAVTRSFDIEEQRREQLFAAGMDEDPAMTTEEAVRRISGDLDRAA